MGAAPSVARHSTLAWDQLPKQPEKEQQIQVVMRGKKTDWKRARKAAKHIRDKKYT